MNYSLRPNQLDTINRINDNLAAGKRVQIIMLPMGSGKSIIASSIIKQFAKEEKQTLVLFSTVAEMQQFESRLKEENCFQNVTTTLIQRLYRDKQKNESPYNKSFDLIISFCNIYSLNCVNKDDNEPSKAEATIEEISNKTNCPIIYFEQSPIPQESELPVISVNNTYNLNAEKFTKDFDNSFSEELKNIENKKTESDESKSINDTVIQEFKALRKRMEEIHLEDTLKLNNIHSDVKEILNTVKKISQDTSKFKDILDTYYDLHNIDNVEAETFTSRVISKVVNEITSELDGIKNTDDFTRAKKLVEIRLNSVWDKISDESKKFLITAKFLFLQNVHFEDEIDYSSICLLSSKAFEVELAKRLVTGYQSYLENILPDFHDWPSSMLYQNKKGNENITEKLDVKNFSLGSCPYIMGILGQNIQRTKNEEYFKKYCKEELLKEVKDKNLNDTIKQLDSYIKYVKDNFRNPAAHKQSMSMTDAENCLDYILEVEKVLKVMLEMFDY